MSQKQTLPVKKRTLLGKKSKRLKNEGLIPGNVYGLGQESLSLAVARKKFESIFDQMGETGLFYLEVEGESKQLPVLIGEVQYDALSSEPTHVSFKQVSLKEKIKAEVPVETVGELNVSDGVVIVTTQSIEIEAFPADIPEKFEINVEDFSQVGDSVSFAQLDYDRSKIKLMVDEEKLDEPVILVQEVKEEVAEEPETGDIEGGAEAGDKTESSEENGSDQGDGKSPSEAK